MPHLETISILCLNDGLAFKTSPNNASAEYKPYTAA